MTDEQKETIMTTEEMLRNSKARERHSSLALAEYKSIYRLMHHHLKLIDKELQRITIQINVYFNSPSSNRKNDVLHRLNKLKEHSRKLQENMTMKGNY